MLKYNGTEVKKITYNGTSIKALIYNGTSIFMKQITTGPYKMSDLYPDEYETMTTVPNRVVFCGTTAKAMFRSCKRLTSIDTSGIDLSEATDLSYMFYNCPSLTSLDLSSFDTSKVTNMRSMFTHCDRLTSLDLSNFDTSNVTNMGGMFRGCSELKSITGVFDLSSITNANNISQMFGSTQLTSITFKNVKSSIKASVTTDLLGMPSNGKITIQNTI